MSQARKRITNRISGDVVLEDLGVRLRGGGSFQDVPAAAVAVSRDLELHRRLVTVEDVRSPEPMPFWPFIRSAQDAAAPPPAPPPRAPADVGPSAASAASEMSEIKKHVAGIEAALQSLLERPPPTSPEVLAAHLRAIQSLSAVPAGLPGGPNLPGPGASSDPMFIPSKIVPDETGGSIKVREQELEKTDLDDGVAALRGLRRK